MTCPVKKKKGTNISLKAFCHTSRMNTILTSMEKWNQMLVLPVGVNCTKIYPLLLDQQESRSDHRERMWSTLRQLLKASEQRTKRGEEKRTDDQLSPFCVSLHRTGAFFSPSPTGSGDRGWFLLCVKVLALLSSCKVQSCFDKTLVVVWFRSLLVKG